MGVKIVEIGNNNYSVVINLIEYDKNLRNELLNKIAISNLHVVRVFALRSLGGEDLGTIANIYDKETAVAIKAEFIKLMGEEQGFKEAYLKRELVDWDDKTPFYDLSSNEYFDDICAIIDAYSDDGVDIKNATPIPTYPVFAREIDANHWEDELPDDNIEDVFDKETIEMLDKLNKKLKKTVIGYIHIDDKRIDLELDNEQ